MLANLGNFGICSIRRAAEPVVNRIASTDFGFNISVGLILLAAFAKVWEGLAEAPILVMNTLINVIGALIVSALCDVTFIWVGFTEILVQLVFQAYRRGQT